MLPMKPMPAGRWPVPVSPVLPLPGSAACSLGARSARLQLVTFSQELVALLEAGLSLVESIETLGEKEASPAVRRTLDQVLVRLREGQTLGAALSEHPQSFPPLYVATVRASERTGALREALQRLSPTSSRSTSCARA